MKGTMVPRFSKQNNRSINACSRYAATDSTATGLAVSGLAATGVVVASAVAFAIVAISSSAFATSTSGNVQLDTEVATSIAMKIQSPNDTNPECMTQSGVTYGTANRYATSNGMEGSKQVDTFDGTEGGADEINTNTSCAMLTMNPNAYDSTYSDVTVYTNSGNGYALTLEAAEPNLVNTTDNTQYIPAGTLTEQDGTGEQAGQKVVPGGQNAWSYKTDNGIITNWTPVSSTAAAIKSYDQETSGGETTRVTYGVSSGNNPTGKYATTLTYTATMFDGDNPYVSKINVSTGSNLTAPTTNLSIPFGQSRTVTVTPAAGYYLSGVTCPTGFTCSGYEIDINNTSAQTITIVNNDTNNTGTLAFSATEIPICSSNLATGEICRNSASDSTLMVKLADGHFWTKNSQGSGAWGNVRSGQKCPPRTTMPSSTEFRSLVSTYGGDSGNLYSATGWSGHYWSSSYFNDLYAWALYVNSTNAYVGAGYPTYFHKTYLYNVVCYR